MKVYVECGICGEKIYLDEVHERPSEYPLTLQLECPNGHHHIYHQEDLRAEKSGSAAAAGALLGGLAGALGGPAGVAIGAGVGGALGLDQDEKEEERVKKFNERRAPFF